jgi:hypothetical protein
MPYRGGRVFAFHWDTCEWSWICEAIIELIEALGSDVTEMPDPTLRACSHEGPVMDVQ